MKKRDLFLLVFVSLLFTYFLMFFPAVYAQTITITGRATSDDVTVSINVTGPPVLVVNKPVNKTYFFNESLRLQVITNANNLWYNLDCSL